LGKLRTDLGYTQKEIAALVEATPQAWALWESGRNRPTPTYIRRMIEIERGERSLNKDNTRQIEHTDAPLLHSTK
jgi:transcriptional regulator with XRE-family HTH domain